MHNNRLVESERTPLHSRNVGTRQMSRLLVVVLLALIGSGCAFLREDTSYVDREYANPKELSLDLRVDRDGRLFHVTLTSIGRRELYEDYYRPGLKLFSVNADGMVVVRRTLYYPRGLYSIPTISPDETVSYAVPFEQFAFLEPGLEIGEKSLIFMEYSSRYGSLCSNTIEISEPLPLRAQSEGDIDTAYRAPKIKAGASKTPGASRL